MESSYSTYIRDLSVRGRGVCVGLESTPAGTEGLELSLRGSKVIGGFSAAQVSGPLAPKLFKGHLPLKWNDTTSGRGGLVCGSGASLTQSVHSGSPGPG